MFGKREKQPEKLNISPNLNTPNCDYNHAIDKFLSDNPPEPARSEYTKIKDNDQTKHVLKFDAIQSKTNENRPLNRHPNIYPYDYNRIVLQKPIKGTDYINGSYITGEKSIKRFQTKACISYRESASPDLSKFANINFLSTQGPLKTTSQHHWQMVYENNVDVIIMLTKVKEGVKEKCHTYWPTFGDLPIRSGQYEVTNFDEQTMREGVIRRDLLVMDCDSPALNCENEVIHLQYLDWPDLGVPQDINYLIKAITDLRKILLEKVLERKGKADRFNVVVHCSAGVGRTGTFLALYKLMDDVDEILKFKKLNESKRVSTVVPETINIFNTVLSLRSKRVEMVQTWEQYKYLYGSLVAYSRAASGLPQLDLHESIYVS